MNASGDHFDPEFGSCTHLRFEGKAREILDG